MKPPDTEFIHVLDVPEEGAEVAPVRPSPKSLPEELPILGLADVVIFPGIPVPLLVESQQSIRLIDDVVAGDRFLGLVLQRRAEVEDPAPDDLWTIGCAGRVVKMLKFPDRTVRVLVEGLRRIRILEYKAVDPYLKAKVEVLKDFREESIELTALSRKAKQLFQEIVKLSPAISDQVKVAILNTDDPGSVSDLIAANLNLPLEERQQLLEMLSVKDRLTRLLPLLNKEVEVLNLGSKIQKEVTTSMNKTQREFFLREQMRAIQRELGEGDAAEAELAQLREQIEKVAAPAEVRQVALKELGRLRHVTPAAPEYTIIRTYLDWIVSLPWRKATDDKVDLDEAERILEEDHYGLKQVKERLLEFLAVIKLKQELKGPILCLVGPPGVGKTSLGRSMAKALGRKFVRISLGGLRDEAEIRGHRRTYVGALPGRIIQNLRRVESNNPVILLDELDKVGSDVRGDPAAALLEVLDPEQNNTFSDLYLDLPFDLSRVLFLTTANWLEPIHPALRDRLEIIELPSYTIAEKIQIAKRYLLPRQMKEHGLKRKWVRWTDSALRQVIQDYTREAGVRQLEREIAAITRKAARRIVTDKKLVVPLTVTGGHVSEYLGQPRYLQAVAGAIQECGIAIGLAWTPVGGDILFNEATRMAGSGKLILTGSLGEVMKESAQIAVSYLRSETAQLGIKGVDFERQDIHIHIPAGATPKDGPSAGAAIVAALASLFSQRRVRSDVAMTGEISLRGRILAVGGLKEKVLAASRSGIKEVILPDQNRKDWAEIPKEVREKIGVRFVRHVSELLALALVSSTAKP